MRAVAKGAVQLLIIGVLAYLVFANGKSLLTGRVEAREKPPEVLAMKVVRVIDGDTFVAQGGGNNQYTVRLIGVNAPEYTTKREPYGREATAFAYRMLQGRVVYLELDAQERDKYGRVLAYVWYSPPPNRSEAEVRRRMFNAEMLLKGYAQVMTVPPNVRYSDLFVKLQREAREAGRGLWGLDVYRNAKAK